MADLFSVTAPLLLSEADGRQSLMAECFRHPGGLLYFELYWHLQRPASRGVHVVQGEVRGEGPWRIGAAVVRVLGCRGTDPELAAAWSEWQTLVNSAAGAYPAREAIENLARDSGAWL